MRVSNCNEISSLTVEISKNPLSPLEKLKFSAETKFKKHESSLTKIRFIKYQTIGFWTVGSTPCEKKWVSNQKKSIILTLNNISEKSLSKTQKGKVINFHGGTTEKITKQLDDLIKGKPEDLIVHVGTNDIANKVNIFNNVKKIFRKVSKDSSLTQLAFSSIIIRKDKNNFEKSILEANNRLRNYYRERGLGYIENNGIKEVHLGKKRLNLNKKGNSALEKVCCATLTEKNDLFFPLT